ncbi:MAG: PLP-dependent aminotransferase family protein [Dehalococcoidia bacterium]|nr:PLP-dependent aminotransferase family protein [Dehalococcoidia bacterium]
MDIVLELPHEPGAPAYRRLAEAIRDGILDGRFRPGEKLPPTRSVAASLKLARNTVLEAYEQLTAEGYLTARHGSGTYVAADLPERALHAPAPASSGPAKPEPAREAPLSAFGRRVVSGEVPLQMRREDGGHVYEFRYGTPSFQEFPMDAWRTLTKRVLDYPPRELLGYGTAEGLPALREALARYLQRSRGVRCSADQVIIVNGSQQALDMAARVLLDPGQTVALEEPCYPGARVVFTANGGQLAPVPCDREGIIVSAMPADARLAYVTPSHQFPTGAVMSAARRLELLRWAEQADAIIIEDDYDSEFRYEGRPLAALQGLDEGNRVLYTGTLSKVLLPALRLGYVVAPPGLHGAIAGTKWLTDRHVALLYQAVLALFIEEGHFERHLRRMRKVYERRRAVLLASFHEHFGERAVVTGTESGMHVLVHIQDVADPAQFIEEARQLGVGIYSAQPYYTLTPPPGASFLMGYSSVTEDGIREGIRLLSKIRA